jgi:peptide deformylase
MAIRKIVPDTDPQIRKISKVVTKFDDRLHELLDDMKETMAKEDGVGLAAVQVGVLKRAFIVEINGMFLECINPQIIKEEGTQEGEEGCLSVLGRTGTVIRPQLLTLTAQDRFGNPFMIKGTGHLSVVLSHENDHLDGILYIDKAIEIFKEGEE